MNAEEKYWFWNNLCHKVYHEMSASDETFIASQHPLCPICNPHLVQGDVKPWDIEEMDEPTIRNGNQTGTTEAGTGISALIAAARVTTQTGTCAPSVATPAGLTAKDEPATKASWAYEPRQQYLRRKLTYFPSVADALAVLGLWTGGFDVDGLPVPSDANLDLWRREVFPVYNSPEPTLNKMRSLRDTLIVSPESGPRLISCGLWSGRYDDEGVPIP